MDLLNRFRRVRAKKLYFAVVIADRPTDGFKVTSDKDCKMFIATGETTPGVVIPATVLKEIVDRFEKAPLDGKVTLSEKDV